MYLSWFWDRCVILLEHTHLGHHLLILVVFMFSFQLFIRLFIEVVRGLFIITLLGQADIFSIFKGCLLSCFGVGKNHGVKHACLETQDFDGLPAIPDVVPTQILVSFPWSFLRETFQNRGDMICGTLHMFHEKLCPSFVVKLLVATKLHIAAQRVQQS